MSLQNAEKFLEELDKNEQLRNEIRNMSYVSDLAKAHGMAPFSGSDMEKALEAKWGVPKNRVGNPHPFTCCCG